jgi:hypothetical protein
MCRLAARHGGSCSPGSWWAGLSAYDPSLVSWTSAWASWLSGARTGCDLAQAVAGLLAGVLAWRGGQGPGVLALLDHALDHGRSSAGSTPTP